MIRKRAGRAFILALSILLASISPALHAQTQPPVQSGAAKTLFLPLVGTGGVTLTPAVRFWAEQYTLPAGGCTMLHWKVPAAEGVWLDGEAVTLQGQQQACPYALQFYTLEVLEKGGESTQVYEVLLDAGDPGLDAQGVIAQATVGSVAAVADADPAEPGNQAGYRLLLKQVRPLWTGTPGWSHGEVSLDVAQWIIDLGQGRPLDWPVEAGDRVEFRAQCQGAACALSLAHDSYLYLIAE